MKDVLDFIIQFFSLPAVSALLGTLLGFFGKIILDKFNYDRKEEARKRKSSIDIIENLIITTREIHNLVNSVYYQGGKHEEIIKYIQNSKTANITAKILVDFNELEDLISTYNTYQSHLITALQESLKFPSIYKQADKVEAFEKTRQDLEDSKVVLIKKLKNIQ